MTEKEKIVQSIYLRLDVEERKHKDSDNWKMIAAHKIYAEHVVKKLNIDDVSKPFFCNDAAIDLAVENYPIDICKEQCNKCKNVC